METGTIDNREFFLRYSKAKKELNKNPDVLSVGLGLKQVKKSLINQLSIKVYVGIKMKQSDVPQANLIPAEIYGIKTDVLVLEKTELVSGDGTRPLIGGIKIAAHEFSVNEGTLGCIAKRKTGEKVMLSNEHVFGAIQFEGDKINGSKVYQPKYSKTLTFTCNEVGATINALRENPVYREDDSRLGESLEEHRIYIDCAIAKINSDIGASNHIKNIGAVDGSDDMIFFTSANPNDWHVKKMGAQTGYTEGIITDIDKDLPADSQNPMEQFRTISIQAIPGKGVKQIKTLRFKEEDIDSVINAVAGFPVSVTKLTNDTLRFETERFCDNGDSGSVILNAQNRVVALLYGRGFLIIQ